MGYYTGNGVVVGGGDQITQQDSVLSGGTLVRECKTKRTTTVKNGVSLDTAKAAASSSDITCGDLTCGSYYWPTPQAAGRIVNYTYSQINGSNLYALTEEKEEYQKRLSAKNGAGKMDHGSWADLP